MPAAVPIANPPFPIVNNLCTRRKVIAFRASQGCGHTRREQLAADSRTKGLVIATVPLGVVQTPVGVLPVTYIDDEWIVHLIDGFSTTNHCILPARTEKMATPELSALESLGHGRKARCPRARGPPIHTWWHCTLRNAPRQRNHREPAPSNREQSTVD